MPGVHAVLTAADIGRPIPTIPFRRPNPTIAPYAQPVIADASRALCGRAVGGGAGRRRRARRGRGRGGRLRHRASAGGDRSARLRARRRAPVRGTGSNRAALIHGQQGRCRHPHSAPPPYTRRESFRIQRLTAMPMETRGLLAEWDAAAGKLQRFRRRQAAVLQSPRHGADDGAARGGGRLPRVRRRRRLRGARRVLSGGFPGARSRPASSAGRSNGWRTGASISWRSPIRARPNARSRWRSTATAPSSACAATSMCDIGAYVRPNGMTPVRNVAQFTSGPYRIPNIHLDAHALVSNKTPAGTYRGPGPVRGLLLLRAAARHGGERARARPARHPPPQPDRARRDAVRLGEREPERRVRRDPLRQRRLFQHLRPLRRGSALEREGSRCRAS